MSDASIFKSNFPIVRLFSMKGHLKQVLAIFFWFSSLMGSASGSEYTGGMSISGESLENGSASSVGFYSESFNMVYLGLSFNHITSSTPIYLGDRTSVSPVFLFSGFKAPWRFAPYIEGGIDLVEGLADEMDNSEDKTESSEDIDYYYSGGINYSITNRFVLSLYAKKYVFKFREDQNGPLIRSSTSGYGLGLSMRF